MPGYAERRMHNAYSGPSVVVPRGEAGPFLQRTVVSFLPYSPEFVEYKFSEVQMQDGARSHAISYLFVRTFGDGPLVQ
jgi:hypothetical protein